MSIDNEYYAQRIGTGGSASSLDVITSGRKRMTVLGSHPAMVGQPSPDSPPAPGPAGAGSWFFRDRGDGKSQFCVRFPSGAVQVIASEP